jgi:hypothetical protein
MGTSWHRVSNGASSWTSGSFWMNAIPAGQTLLRTRFSWGFTITTRALTDPGNTQFNAVIFGIVTTIGNGTEAVPDPRAAPDDAAPPTRRWLWWELRWPVMTAIDEAADVIHWRDSGPQGPVDTQGQVLATGIPGGDTLNVWAAWAPAFGLDSPSDSVIWVDASMLTKT